MGLSFGEANRGLKELVKADFQYAERESNKRWMFCWDEKKRSLVLEEFDKKKAIAHLEKGEAVIPIWLDRIHRRLKEKLPS